jgi:hypothetical protein
MIVGLGHQSDVGKDTAARELKLRLGAHVLRFSGGVKSVSYDLFSHLGLRRGHEYELEGGRELRKKKLPVIDKTPEEIWIEIGTKMREIYEPVWSDRGMREATEYLDWAPGSKVVAFPDVRSLIEADAIKRAGGVLIKITRPGNRVLGLDTLIPDDWSGWDAVIENTGTPAELGDKVEAFVRKRREA